ncbi:hypothetical protein ACTQZS_08110 [Bilifractor sp. LCP19S3_H10]|uniref:hypothetical protein n=1 Tax=Bilifractor sp. LCP19S3_H10 TaxID=3438736 RepID=UPI003F93A082
MIARWEIEKARKLTTNQIKNFIWGEITCGTPVPGCISVDALRYVLRERGEDDCGYHDT